MTCYTFVCNDNLLVLLLDVSFLFVGRYYRSIVVINCCCVCQLCKVLPALLSVVQNTNVCVLFYSCAL